MKDWLDYFDFVVTKLLIAAISAAAVWMGLIWNRDSNRRNLELLQRQVDNQIRATDQQRLSSATQIMTNMMPYLNCKHPLSLTALQVVQSGAPDFSLTAANALAGCAKTPKERARVAELRSSAQRSGIRAAFLLSLSNAADYLAVGLDEQAVTEYQTAYKSLPAELDRYVNHDAAERALQILSEQRTEQRIHEAAQLFESAFNRVDLNLQDMKYSSGRR